MKIIRTASYLKTIKEAQGVGEILTPANEDQYAEDQAVVDRRKRKFTPFTRGPGKGRRSLNRKFLQDSAAEADFEEILRKQVNEELEEANMGRRRKLLQLRSKTEIKEATGLGESWIKELFDINLEEAGDPEEAADRTIGIAVSVMSKGKLDDLPIQTKQPLVRELISIYGGPEDAPIEDTPMGLEDDNPIY
jgi:hypothetical protein